MGNKLWELKDSNQLTDTTLEGKDGRRASVHRAVLASCSPYFRALFLSNSEKPSETTLLNNVPFEVLEDIVKFAYGRRIEINKETVGELIVWSDYLDVPRFGSLKSVLYSFSLFNSNTNTRTDSLSR